MIPAAVISNVLGEIAPDEVIRLTAELVRILSVWDPAAGTGEKAAGDFVARWAERQGFGVEVDEVAPGRPNVIVTWDRGTGDRTLMFEGHTDVVTPGDVAAWSRDPFSAEVEGRRMYGRGTNDTKGNLAALLVTMAALKRSRVELAGTVVGAALCDEEDQMLGVQDFIRRGRADRVTAAVICEPEDGLICASQKGAIRARYTVTGRMSHGAMPLSGLNTAPAVARLIQGLHRLELEAADRFGRDELLGWPSFTPTVIQAPPAGAAQLNVMPGQARILVDIRTIPGEPHDEVRTRLTDLAKAVERETREAYGVYDSRLGHRRASDDLRVQVEFLTDRPCTSTDRSDPVVLAADWATRRITGREPVYGGVPGATDGTYLSALRGIPIVTMGAGERHVPHQVDEWVDLDQLVDTARIYALTALCYLYPGAPR